MNILFDYNYGQIYDFSKNFLFKTENNDNYCVILG